jgi:hypothetical protein
MHIWTSERGMLGLTPLPGTDLWQLQSPIRPDEDPEDPSLQVYQAMFDERAGAVTLTSATWTSILRVNLGWKLGAVLRGANDALLDTYGEERSRSPARSWLTAPGSRPGL